MSASDLFYCIGVQRIPSPADQQQPQARQIGHLFGANGLNGGRNAPMRVAVAGYESIPIKMFVNLFAIPLPLFIIIIIMNTLKRNINS